MSLEPEDIVWAFDGRDGRDGGLRAMIGFYVNHLRTLLPADDGADDPFDQIVAELQDDPTNRMLSNPRLARLFPPAFGEEQEADEFWRDSIHNQTRERIRGADVVVADLDGYHRSHRWPRRWQRAAAQESVQEHPAQRQETAFPCCHSGALASQGQHLLCQIFS